MKWYASIAVLSSLISAPAWGATQTAQPPDAAALYEGSLRPYAGSREAVQVNLVTPLIQGTQLTTPDGSRSFSVDALQPSGKPLLRISAFLNMPTGDLTGITVEQDLTGAGAINSVSVFPLDGNGRLIAAVCADGYVQCDAGTYNNCQYRTWTADPTGKIGAVVAGPIGPQDVTGSISALSSCFCFNHYCSQNNSAALNIDTIAADIGSAVLTAFLSSRNDFAISSVKNDGSGTISYYGVQAQGSVKGGNTAAMTPQQAAAMPILPATDPATAQAYYSASPGTLDAMGTTALQAQQALPGSLFNVVNNTMMNLTGQNFYCTNRRSVSLLLNHYTQSLEKGFSDNASMNLCTDDRVFLIFTQDAQGNFAIGYEDTGPGGYGPGANCHSEPFDPELNHSGHLVDTLVVTPPPQSTDVKITKADAYFKGWGLGCFTGEGTATWLPGASVPIATMTSIWCPASGPQFPNYAYRIGVEYDSQETQEMTDMGCAQYDSDPTCKLQQDLWDNRPVYANFTPTGFRLAQVCKNIPGPMRNVQVCRDWWEQDRIYICQHNRTSYDFSGVQQRLKGIQDTVNMPDDKTMSFADNGSNLTYGVFPKGQLPACQQVCKTKVPAPESLITPLDPKSMQQSASGVAGSSWRFYYKSCIESPAGTFTCPLDAKFGEVVVQDCSCSGDIGDAIGALQAVDGAAQDMICAPN